MDTIFFKDIPGIGDLILDKILFEFEGDPIIAICKDEKSNRYLCICDDVIEKYSWIVTSISTDMLIELLKGEITLLSPFKESKDKIVIADCNFDSDEYIYTFSEFNSIDKNELPHKDQYLIRTEDFKDYIDVLSNSMFIADVSYPLQIDYEYMNDLYNSLKFLNQSINDKILPVLMQTANMLTDYLQNFESETFEVNKTVVSESTLTVNYDDDLSYAA